MKKFIGNILHSLGLVKKQYQIDAFVFTDGDGNIVENQITDSMVCIAKFSVKAYSPKESVKLGFELVNKKFPEYEHKVWLL